jgi:hypothetical protein
MMRRVMVVIFLAVDVGFAWALIAGTSWAASVDPLTAGGQFADALAPIREITGMLLVTVPAALLIRSSWTWIATTLMGREAPRRIPVSRGVASSRARIPGGGQQSAAVRSAITTREP